MKIIRDNAKIINFKGKKTIFPLRLLKIDGKN